MTMENVSVSYQKDNQITSSSEIMSSNMKISSKAAIEPSPDVIKEQPKSKSNVFRLGNCEVCNIIPAIYTCPKCELKTCCLNCVNIHKKEFDCDGIRDKVKFVPLQKFTNLDLQSDFILLEQISNSIYKYKRDPLRNAVTIYNKLPYPIHMLRKYAYSRKIQLKFLPRVFTNHKINTSCVHKNKLYWRVEWIFVNTNIKRINEKLIDSTRLCLALREHLDQPELAFYKSAGVNRLLILMKIEKSDKFHLLDNTLSLCDNLKNKCVIEFPILYVIFEHEKDMFEIDLEEFEPTTVAESTQVDIQDITEDHQTKDGQKNVNTTENENITQTNDGYYSISYEYDY